MTDSLIQCGLVIRRVERSRVSSARAQPTADVPGQKRGRRLTVGPRSLEMSLEQPAEDLIDEL